MRFYVVSGLGRVILILFVIIDELCEFIKKTLKALLCYIFPNNCRVHSRCQTGVFWEYVWHGTQLFKALCKTLRYAISMQCYCYYACCVLWMCYEHVLWMCYECVMNVSWMYHECVMRCVMDVLWMWGMGYGCVRDIMDALGIVINVLRMYAWWMNDGYFISTV